MVKIKEINNLHIHGDNIVECERVLELILNSFGDEVEKCSLNSTSVVCPSFSLKLKKDATHRVITFFPGFGRWKTDILSAIHDRGGVLREAADAIVTEIKDNEEKLLFAIEFCGALPAGNQAWQRSGRAYSYGVAKIPYLYISELGGYELDKKRNRKASRLPNPAVPFSYLSFSNEMKTPVIPIFITAPNADEASREKYKNEFASADLFDFVKSILLEQDASQASRSLQGKVISFIEKRAESSRKNETLSASQWQKIYDNMQAGIPISNFLIEKIRQSWEKITYIKALTHNAKELMSFAKKKGIGLTSTKLPICLLDVAERKEFLNFLDSMYNAELSQDFRNWLNRDEPLGICWIMGFKPKGDDARPDRGLAPLARMLLGANHDLLSIVYGPASKLTWNDLENTPTKLAEKNGLWEAILTTSDAILIESKTDENITKKGYTKSHWSNKLHRKEPSSFLVSTTPMRYGENDVDTAVHILLKRLCDDKIFEGMCNPPGGDWSGVSILSNRKEIRWVSLPRVSGSGTKRPDHVFQFCIDDEIPTILSIESKEKANKLEKNIGEKLTKYLQNLFKSKANIERPIGSTSWSKCDITIGPEEFEFASAVAFLSESNEKDKVSISNINADLIFVVKFEDNGENCRIYINAKTSSGKKLSQHIEKHLTRKDVIKISVN